ncbi:uncharacterized protein LOC142617523 isoform X3 [Castanea sativa]|uniref:uncharacterized protein LOC142617523 isoform X3 n=1 Tax=Castanea sativa TaxID=21020 RepID=UPI003F64BA36
MQNFVAARCQHFFCHHFSEVTEYSFTADMETEIIGHDSARTVTLLIVSIFIRWRKCWRKNLGISCLILSLIKVGPVPG